MENKPRLNTLGEFLRAKRRAEHLSLRDAAEEIDVSHSTLSEIERGLRRPDLETLVGISEAYGVPLDTIVRMAAHDAGLWKKETPLALRPGERAAILAGLAETFPALSLIVDHLTSLPPEHFRAVLVYMQLLDSDQQDHPERER